MEQSLAGNECLGIEFGSTRIKALLIDDDCSVVASGDYEWENRYENGYWTYHLDDVIIGLQSAFKKLNEQCVSKFGTPVKKLSAIGISAMMHGYLPFDKDDNLLAEFRTWRNTTTAQAAGELTKLFSFNIPQRWSIAHLYQAILNGESHVAEISRITTLAGYVHYLLSGKNVLGVGEASGMFPIDSKTLDYDDDMIAEFSSLDAVKKAKIDIKKILPAVLKAGDIGGFLTPDGAKLLDSSGQLEPGAVMCPPEGDAGTGMVATNSIAEKTGNISAGTSVFSMVVLEKRLSKVYEQIDMVTTPDGKPVAMVHCNNCCTDIDYWVRVFDELLKAAGCNIKKSELYDILYNSALDGDCDCGGLLNYNFFSGEPVLGTEAGRPLFVRKENSSFTLSNFMRAQIYSALAVLKSGMVLLENENVKIDRLTGHGGLYKTKFVGQQITADAMNTPVTVLENAGEGGAWGIALLAKFSLENGKILLNEFLDKKVFAAVKSTTVNPNKDGVIGFEKYMHQYKKGLAVQISAYKNI